MATKPPMTRADETPIPFAMTAVDAEATMPILSTESREHMVRQEAYLLAEADGFHRDAADYWMRAERLIAARPAS